MATAQCTTFNSGQPFDQESNGSTSRKRRTKIAFSSDRPRATTENCKYRGYRLNEFYTAVEETDFVPRSPPRGLCFSEQVTITSVEHFDDIPTYNDKSIWTNVQLQQLPA